MGTIISEYFAKYRGILVTAGIALVIVLISLVVNLIDKNRISEMNRKLAIQQEMLNRLQASNHLLRADSNALRQENDQLNKSLEQIRLDAANKTATIFEHDFGSLGAKKPRLMEKRVNNATKEFNRRMEEKSRVEK